MTKLLTRTVLIAFLLLVPGAPRYARAQQLRPASGAKVAPAPVAQPLSLGDAARKAREQRKAAPHATKVYTNDDLPRNSSISIVGAEPAPPPPESAAAPDTKAASAAEAAPETPSATKKAARHDEADWRERFAKQRAKLRQAQDEEAALQRDQGRVALQFYGNPQEALTQSITRSDITAANNKLATKKQEVRQLTQSLEDLQDALRKSGGDPGWGRE